MATYLVYKYLKCRMKLRHSVKCRSTTPLIKTLNDTNN